MNIIIPFQGRVQTIIRSSFLVAKRQSVDQYQLKGEMLQMSGVKSNQIVIVPDGVAITEGETLTDDILMQALPLETFVKATAEEALPTALGLLLRLAVADGRLNDGELLSIQPVLEGRLWQPGIKVEVGDVYSFGPFLWKCKQAHTTQGDWPPDMTPALWQKVEIVHEDTVRVWAEGIEYIVGDEVAYPDENGIMYECQQAHTSQAGWEPPTVHALWKSKAETEPDTPQVNEIPPDA